MKAGLGLVVVVALGVIGYFVMGGQEPATEVAEPEQVETSVEPERTLVDLEMPPEVAEEIVVPEEELEPATEAQKKERLKKPRFLSRTMLPDGRVEVRILSPIYVAGKQRNVIRVLRGSPRLMKEDAVQQRIPDVSKGRKR